MLFLNTKRKGSMTYIRTAEGQYAFNAHNMNVPTTVEALAGFIRSESKTNLDVVEMRLEELDWLDLLSELRLMRKLYGTPELPPPELETEIPMEWYADDITCWRLEDGFILYELSTDYVRHEQKVYMTGQELVVDKWEMGRSSYWEEEFFISIAAVHFLALGLMLGIENPSPIMLMQAIAVRYTGEKGYDKFLADIRKYGVEHKEQMRRE